MISVSTASEKKVTLDVKVSGIAMSELEAQKFASSVQSNMCYTLGVDCDNLVVNVTSDPSEADSEDDTEASVDDVSSMNAKTFAKNRAALRSQLAPVEEE